MSKKVEKEREAQQMRIALCDSDAAASSATKQMIYEYASIHNIELVVSEYRSGKALLSEWEKYHLVILDYMSEDLNGLETAHFMRQKGGMCGIIFLSADTGFIFESFKVHPYRFLLKPLLRESLFRVLDDFFTAGSVSSPLFIKDGGDTFCLRTGDIFYIEADNKNCLVNLRNGSIRCHKTMARVYDSLPKSCFSKINRAYIVNLKHIAAYSSDTVKLHNGERLHMSRSYSKSFQAEYRAFLKPMEL